MDQGKKVREILGVTSGEIGGRGNIRTSGRREKTLKSPGDDSVVKHLPFLCEP